MQSMSENEKFAIPLKSFSDTTQKRFWCSSELVEYDRSIGEGPMNDSADYPRSDLPKTPDHKRNPRPAIAHFWERQKQFL